MKKPQDDFITFFGRKGSGKDGFHQHLSAFHPQTFVELDIWLEINSKVGKINLTLSIFSANTGHFLAVIMPEINTSAKNITWLQQQYVVRMRSQQAHLKHKNPQK